jgi:hypothetical protein
MEATEGGESRSDDAVGAGGSCIELMSNGVAASNILGHVQEECQSRPFPREGVVHGGHETCTPTLYERKGRTSCCTTLSCS